MVLRSGHLKNGYQVWQKEELGKGVNTAWIQTLTINSCTFEQLKGIFSRECYWSWVTKQCTVTERIYRVHLPRRERECIEFDDQKWVDSKRKKPQKRKTIRVLHYSESNGRWKWLGRNSTRLDETKDRAIQEYLETLSKYNIWCNLKLAQENDFAILQNSVTCSLSLQHTTCSLHWDSGMYENTRSSTKKLAQFQGCHGFVPKSNSQYGQQDPRSQEPRSSWDPSSDSKSYGETCSNIVDCRISGVPLPAVEQQDTTRENKVKKLIEKCENHQHKEPFLQDLS